MVMELARMTMWDHIWDRMRGTRIHTKCGEIMAWYWSRT
ncbi:unnamed protein product [Schistosoma margrebowiei]|uniref:Uncharacterized protein n=1 Tax=Schistosoma margrebowiei TaxID=48269 RepID=A0A183MBI1_9TREM|nr:unnamed protein product [Schistosoma margrebowiei]